MSVGLLGAFYSDSSNWPEHYRQLWLQRLERLDDYLRELQSREEHHGDRQ
jgi:hypothetical protein